MGDYDTCVANKEVEGSQMTVCWHVHDLKVSHVDGNELTKFSQWLNNTYGISIVLHRGKVHNYLGMTLDYSMQGRVKVTMIYYIKWTTSDFPEEIVANKTTPAADWLFNVRPEGEAKLLPEEQVAAFHHVVAQLLFLCNRSQRDIKTAVLFLTTCVRKPDEDDWGKLKRVLGYLKGTLHILLVLGANSITTARWWVDASYGVHTNCKVHTSAGMSMGHGMLLSYSWKQKVNTRSSMEAELVGVDDALRHILWCRYFLDCQGHDMEPLVLYQGNKNAILMETNGKSSSSKRTKHIRIQYFFIQDKVDQQEISIEHHPTDQMWIDINTKPKQGLQFCQFWSELMGIPVEYNDDDYKEACKNTVNALSCASGSPQECVGDSK